MSKGFLAIIAVVIIAFAGFFILNGHKSGSGNSGSSSSAKATNHVEGQGKSGVKLIEYGDYQCPYCEEAYPVVKQAESQFADQIYFQFRNFPLINVHQNAFAGARAAEAAALQNKFWQMHDLLYENQNQWSTASNPSTYFNQYAKQLGLNVAQFQKDYASSKVNDTINADIAAGNALKVDATPTFFLDGKQIELTPTDPSSVNAFKQQIQDAINQKSSQTKQ
ncbi:MAG TPA: thioredoxin domain-containing protein [Candidatus Saccharimonadales bacterium]|nr:thioredoxin domain-containing protein [Candidatus Saccharimonadales bacterium]